MKSIKKLGDLVKDEKNLFDKADILVQHLPSDDKLLNLKQNQSLIGVLNPFLINKN